MIRFISNSIFTQLTLAALGKQLLKQLSSIFRNFSDYSTFEPKIADKCYRIPRSFQPHFIASDRTWRFIIISEMELLIKEEPCAELVTFSWGVEHEITTQLTPRHYNYVIQKYTFWTVFRIYFIVSIWSCAWVCKFWKFAYFLEMIKRLDHFFLISVMFW